MKSNAKTQIAGWRDISKGDYRSIVHKKGLRLGPLNSNTWGQSKRFSNIQIKVLIGSGLEFYFEQLSAN